MSDLSRLKAQLEFEGTQRDAPKTYKGFVQALRGLGVDVRENVRSAKVELRVGGEGAAWFDGGQYWRSVLVEAIAANYYESGRKGDFPLEFGRDKLKTAVESLLSQHQVDPFRDWLLGLPPWEGESRLGGLLAHCFDVWLNDPDLVEWASAAPILTAVERTLHPGAKVDEMPVFVGDQGIGKSTWVRCLLPAEHQLAWFGDGLRLNDDDKGRVEATQGKVIVEVSEMVGSTRAEIEGIKSYLSRQNDEVRLSYRSDPQPRPRLFSMVGTTNSRRSLPNERENRRFVPVDLAALNGAPNVGRIIDYLGLHNEQLWAEGLAIVRSGGVAHLPPALKAAQEVATERHRYADDVNEQIVENLALSVGSLTDLMKSAGIPANEHDRKRAMFTRALRNLGWQDCLLRTCGVVSARRHWHAPTGDTFD